MIKNISLNILGAVVGLLLLGGLWACAIGIGWVIAIVFKFIFAIIPYSAIIIKWILGIAISVFVVLVSWGVGVNIVKGYINK